MIISKNFCVPEHDDSLNERIIKFWSGRGINLLKDTKSSLTGKRGNFLGNLISYDTSKLITKLTVKIENGRIICEFNINTVFQYITNLNKKFWELELETFESFILNNENQDELWKEYYKESRRSNFIWTIFIIIFVLIIFFATRTLIGQ